LYFARRSDLKGAPVLIWPCNKRGIFQLASPLNLSCTTDILPIKNWKHTVDKPTAKSAMNVSSVSPLQQRDGNRIFQITKKGTSTGTKDGD
jgi:hypothetical protein